MIRQGMMLLLLACAAAGGCASLEPFAVDAPVAVQRTNPIQAYDAGRLALVRGDYAAARREWDHCLAISAPDSPVRLDCLVALEKSVDPASFQP